jgi:hypothetical protein
MLCMCKSYNRYFSLCKEVRVVNDIKKLATYFDELPEEDHIIAVNMYPHLIV